MVSMTASEGAARTGLGTEREGSRAQFVGHVSAGVTAAAAGVAVGGWGVGSSAVLADRYSRNVILCRFKF